MLKIYLRWLFADRIAFNNIFIVDLKIWDPLLVDIINLFCFKYKICCLIEKIKSIFFGAILF